MGLPVRTLQDLIKAEQMRRYPVNATFLHMDQRIKQLESELATSRRAVAFLNDVVEKLRQSYTAVPVVYRE